jgi:hypothetical protein
MLGNNWSCLPQAFATALDITFDEFVDLIGHDGSIELWPHLPDPLCRRGFTIQECIKACLGLGYAVTPIAITYKHRSTSDIEPLNMYDRDFFNAQVRISKGVLTGATKKCHHAVAYINGYVYETSGSIYPFDSTQPFHNFIPECLWRIDRIQ